MNCSWTRPTAALRAPAKTLVVLAVMAVFDREAKATFLIEDFLLKGLTETTRLTNKAIDKLTDQVRERNRELAAIHQDTEDAARAARQATAQEGQTSQALGEMARDAVGALVRGNTSVVDMAKQQGRKWADNGAHAIGERGWNLAKSALQSARRSLTLEPGRHASGAAPSATELTQAHHVANQRLAGQAQFIDANNAQLIQVLGRGGVTSAQAHAFHAKSQGATAAARVMAATSAEHLAHRRKVGLAVRAQAEQGQRQERQREIFSLQWTAPGGGGSVW